jgi:4-hydroxy-3-polyprenylbenzoate decarboxylase
LPENLNEMHLAGFLQQQPLELVAGLSNGLPVPATAEMIIEGFVTPGNMRTGGSFGNHTGAYVAGGMVPELQVTAITRRKRPVCAATVVGPPPMEDCWLAKAAERLLLPLLRRELPEIVDIHMPLEGIFHGCAIMAMKKEGSGHPRRVLDALWRRGWLRDARLLLLVDAEIGVADLSLVTWKVVNNVVWSRDLHIVAGRTTGHGERAGIDATGKRPVAHPSASEMAASPAIAQLIASRWREYGLE